MAGIFGILCFALPVVVGSLEGVLYGVWMWGLYSGSLGGIVVTLFIPDDIGVIASILILGASIIICITIIKARKLRRDKKIGIMWAILGAIILIAVIIYLIDRWTIFMLPGAYFHLAIYLSIWAGSSALVSGLRMTRISTSEKEKRKGGLDEEQPECPDCQSNRSLGMETCQNCGKKLK